MSQDSEGYILKPVIRQDYFDILNDLPRLPEGTRPLEPFTRGNPVIEDIRTGEHYKLDKGNWELADK